MIQKLGKISFIITTLIVLVLGTAQWMRGKNAFSLKRIKIQGTRVLNDTRLLHQANIEYNKDIFDIELAQIEHRLKSNQMIKEINVKRQIPSTIKIEVTERELVAVIFIESRMHGVDGDGVIISQIDRYALYDLPVLSGVKLNDVMHIEKGYSSELQQIAPHLKRLKKMDPLMYHRISEINYRPNLGFTIYLRNDSVPVLLGLENADQKLNRLAFAYPRIEEDFAWSNVEHIDLRFDSQVIVKGK
ncbi:FtsQ-type POTRA domain-containing protein [candidate division KSB1 bacterium]|nr:FtsQ-type POTRA domain-containing protein [candidate division KSB1 bacterium]